MILASMYSVDGGEARGKISTVPTIKGIRRCKLQLRQHRADYSRAIAGGIKELSGEAGFGHQ